jgi:hypothetical protein
VLEALRINLALITLASKNLTTLIVKKKGGQANGPISIG